MHRKGGETVPETGIKLLCRDQEPLDASQKHVLLREGVRVVLHAVGDEYDQPLVALQGGKAAQVRSTTAQFASGKIKCCLKSRKILQTTGNRHKQRQVAPAMKGYGWACHLAMSFEADRHP
jgi:hypothetical protein